MRQHFIFHVFSIFRFGMPSGFVRDAWYSFQLSTLNFQVFFLTLNLFYLYLERILDVPWTYLSTISYIPKDKKSYFFYNFEFSISLNIQYNFFSKWSKRYSCEFEMLLCERNSDDYKTQQKAEKHMT